MVAASGSRRAVFLDRDGVLVIPEFRDGRSFAPLRLENYRFYPDAAACLGRLKDAGYLLVVVTNQPDVGKGLISTQTMDEMHRRLLAELPVEQVKVCAHRQDENCVCRKPGPKLLLDAAHEFNIDLSESFMVGDRGSDIEAGRTAGCRTIFIDLGYSESKPNSATFIVASLREAAEAVLGARTPDGDEPHDVSC
jgi:D-glycero-D-manno-heptose 1,7-bisphosphate phosphatase